MARSSYLSVFFSAPGNTSVDLSAEQRTEILKWFWRSCFSRRYSSDVIRKLEIDIAEMRKLKDGEDNKLSEIPTDVDADFFLDATFNTYGVNTKCLILLLAQYGPRSFISGAPVGLGRASKTYNRNEFHHCFPRAFLKNQAQPKDYNKLANFVFMSSIDNKRLAGDAPSVYKAKMFDEAVPGILEHAVCPESLFSDDFSIFVKERADPARCCCKRPVLGR